MSGLVILVTLPSSGEMRVESAINISFPVALLNIH